MTGKKGSFVNSGWTDDKYYRNASQFSIAHLPYIDGTYQWENHRTGERCRDCGKLLYLRDESICGQNKERGQCCQKESKFSNERTYERDVGTIASRGANDLNWEMLDEFVEKQVEERTRENMKKVIAKMVLDL